jgi:hypothetical protein
MAILDSAATAAPAGRLGGTNFTSARTPPGEPAPSDVDGALGLSSERERESRRRGLKGGFASCAISDSLET